MIAKANEVMNIFYLSDEERATYLVASLYESDRASMLGESKREDIAEGIEKGFYDAKMETAKNCLALSLPFATITKITGLSEKEIEGLKDVSKKL